MELTNPCREWDLERNKPSPNGYIEISLDGHKHYLHRVAWLMENGAIPRGMLVRHLCHNKICYEATHLALGTQLDNMRDSARDGRLGKPSLDEAQLRDLYTDGLTQRQIAAQLGVGIKRVIGAFRRYNIQSRTGSDRAINTWKSRRVIYGETGRR